jgi:transcription-repair coupling factor (superfamily II helicase)
VTTRTTPFWARSLPKFPEAGSTIALAGAPDGAVALSLLHWRAALGKRPLIYMARSEARAERIAHMLAAFEAEPLLLPGWDCLPYDRVSPSHGAMGQRVAALHALRDPASKLILTTAPAALQRLPARDELRDGFAVASGDALDEAALRGFLAASGYVFDDRVDEPGEAAFHGRTIDIFPGNAPPIRIETDADRITELRRYDPVEQRTQAALEQFEILPVNEALAGDGSALSDELRAALYDGDTLRLGAEHFLPLFYRRLETLFDMAADAALVADAEVPAQAREHVRRIADGFAFATELLRTERRHGGTALPPLDSKRLYLDAEALEAAIAGAVTLTPPVDGGGIGEALPPFRGEGRSQARRFIAGSCGAGARVVVATPDVESQQAVVAQMRRANRKPDLLSTWSDVAALRPGALALLPADVAQGFIVDDLCVIPAAALAEPAPDAARMPGLRAAPLQIGDRVIHIDHGIGVLAGLQAGAAESDEEHLALEYADGRLLVPVDAMDRVWRYGADPDVPLDRLRGGDWDEQKAKLLRAISEAAAGLIKAAKAREAEKADMIVPPLEAYGRFAARFPYELTPGQDAAIQDVLADLASGHRMDRLICGDVGFGKTEVALRAAAAAALSGRQVAFVAPTTVLVGQHARTLRERFAAFDVEVGELSRLTKPAEARRVKEGLKSGAILIVIGTHAVMSATVRFKDLALTIIDEEQRFGVRQKAALGRRRRGHALSMTATPIPRTLQAAMVGVRSCSVLRTPPVKRQGTRTFVLPWSDDLLREAVLREKRRSGGSFVVCPRIADLPEMEKRLRCLLPGLDIVAAHGRMPPAEIDDAILSFARGETDVLLSTDIVESGLDIPRANTMVVQSAYRFGLSQLHQLRGRVGRGRRRGICYFLVPPASKDESLSRLKALEAAQQLGAGFAVSAADLDRRGAGDLLGLEQAGHGRLIGTELYQHLLSDAIARARGEKADEAPLPTIELGMGGAIPAGYVAEPEPRIALYRRLAACRSPVDIDALAEEIDDRFGDFPPEVETLMAVWRLRLRAHEAGIAEIKAGPGGVAVRMRDESRKAWSDRDHPGWEWQGDRLVRKGAFGEPRERLDAALALLDSEPALAG